MSFTHINIHVCYQICLLSPPLSAHTFIFDVFFSDMNAHEYTRALSLSRHTHTHLHMCKHTHKHACVNKEDKCMHMHKQGFNTHRCTNTYTHTCNLCTKSHSPLANITRLPWLYTHTHTHTLMSWMSLTVAVSVARCQIVFYSKQHSCVSMEQPWWRY